MLVEERLEIDSTRSASATRPEASMMIGVNSRPIHRPARDIDPPAAELKSFWSFGGDRQTAAGAASLVQRNSVPSIHMRCLIPPSRRASATTAFCRPRPPPTFTSHALPPAHLH